MPGRGSHELPRRSAGLHWPALDGLRAIAVIAVMAYHAFPKLAPHGDAGVDVFFVLSGFLITTLLLSERARDGRVSLRNFYVRRALRLVPALGAAVIGVLAIAYLDGELRSALPGAMASILYLSHVTIALGVDSGLLSHTWTLSLEEHFYLFWPLVLLSLLRGGVRRWLAVLALVGLGIAVLPGVLPGDLGYMYWRGLAMLVGSGLALALTQREVRPSTGWTWAGMACLVALTVVVLSPVSVPGMATAGPLGLATLLSVVVITGFVKNPASIVSRLLAGAPLVWLGKRAYGLYLFHFPILLSPLVPGTLERVGIDAPVVLDLFIALGLTVGVAGASYRWVEVPFLRLKERFRSTGQPLRLATPGRTPLADGVPGSQQRSGR